MAEEDGMSGHWWPRAFRRSLGASLLFAIVAPASLFGGGTAARAANPIVTENQQPGSSAWQIGKMADGSNGQIKGYASATSVSPNQNITLYITVNPAQTYSIDVYRMGWYAGQGGRLRLHAGPLNGTRQQTCPTDATTGLIACSWTPSYTITVGSDWTSGVYLALLTNAAGYQNYAIFVVRDGRPAPLLYQLSLATYQAYNNWPDDNATGKSLYTYNSYGARTVSGDARAVKVSFDRPYAWNGAGNFTQWEIEFVRWVERSGYDITYSNDLDTHENGAALRNSKGVIAVGHTEYWSREMLTAVQGARDAGVNIGFFAADEVGWQVRFEASAAGVVDRVMVCYKDATTDPVQGSTTTIQWRSAQLNYSSQTMVGQQFSSQLTWGQNVPYVVSNSSNWVYANTGFHDGDSVPGIVGYEVDRFWTTFPGPNTTNQTLLSHSPLVDTGGRSDTATSSIYQAPSNAWVFSAGTISWSWGLDNFDHTVADSRIQQTTTNILNAFINSAPPPPPPPLQISQVQAGSLAATSAVITWQSNNAANSRVDYGLAATYGTVVTDASLLISHSINLSGLAASTIYHYKVTSVDGAGQTASSTDATFSTAAPTNNVVTNPGFESGSASWGLDPNASIDTTAANAHSGSNSLKLVATAGWQGSAQWVQVTAGTSYTITAWEKSSTAGGTLSLISYDANWNPVGTVHTDLGFGGSGGWTSLSATYVPPTGATQAWLGLQSAGAGTFWFDDITLSSGTPPPALQVNAVQAGSLTATSALITWTTTNVANSRVDYGLTGTYGSVVTDTTSVTSHSLALTTLSASTTYHYQVTSVDGFGQTAKSVDATFTTAAPPLLQVNAVQAGSLTTSSAVISWTTTNAANSRVDYGLTASYGSNVTNATSQTSHSLALTNLSSSTTYHYQVTSVDGFGQTAKSVDATFTTTAPPVLQVSAVQAGSLTASSAAITWTTTNAASSRVDYGLTGTYGSNVTDATSVTGHSLTLTNLSASTTYHYQVTSVDGFGQTAMSADATFTTTAVVTNVLVTDSFNRTVSGGWGAAEVGGSWSVVDTAANWSVTPGAGSVTVGPAGEQRAYLPTATVQDVDVLVTGALPRSSQGNNCLLYVLGRFTPGASPSYYRVGVGQGNGSTLTLRAQRSDGAYVAADVNTGIPAADGIMVDLRVEFQGINPTTIRARAWQDGTAEPSTWSLVGTDSNAAQQITGAVGLRGRNDDSSASHTFQIRSYQARRL